MSTIKQNLTIFLLCFLSAFQLGCLARTSNYELIDNFPIPEEAYNVKKLEFDKNTHQLFFQVTESYPSIKLIERYRDFLSKESWTSCTDSNEGWSSYEDLSDGNHLLVHNFYEHWIDKGNSKLLILGAIYYSHDLSKCQPDNKEQRLIIWVHRTTDLKSALSTLGIICD